MVSFFFFRIESRIASPTVEPSMPQAPRRAAPPSFPPTSEPIWLGGRSVCGLVTNIFVLFPIVGGFLPRRHGHHLEVLTLDPPFLLFFGFPPGSYPHRLVPPSLKEPIVAVLARCASPFFFLPPRLLQSQELTIARTVFPRPPLFLTATIPPSGLQRKILFPRKQAVPFPFRRPSNESNPPGSLAKQFSSGPGAAAPLFPFFSLPSTYGIRNKFYASQTPIIEQVLGARCSPSSYAHHFFFPGRAASISLFGDSHPLPLFSQRNGAVPPRKRESVSQ